MKKVSSRRRSSKKKTTTPKKAVYPVKNWTVYDQALVQRGSLTVWLSEEAIDGWSYTGPTQRGAQFEYSDLAIETALTFRKLFHLPLRQTEGFIRSLLELDGFESGRAGSHDAGAAAARVDDRPARSCYDLAPRCGGR